MTAASMPGADELRVRHLLVTAGVGPDADLPPLPDHLPPGYEPAAWSWDAYFDGADPIATCSLGALT